MAISDQRAAILGTHFTGANQNLRPILTSLNGDNSWLLSIPLPKPERESSGRAYFHIVSDAWLTGPAITVSSWLIELNLPAEPSAHEGAGVESICREIEDAAAAAGVIHRGTHRSPSLPDAIFANFHYKDHLHEATLRTFDANVPVFAVPEAATIIQSWNHFASVATIHDLIPGDGNWRSLHPGGSLPEWLSVFRLVGHHELNFMMAFVWSSDQDTAEAILYSPHGIRLDQPSTDTWIHDLKPPVSTLAMLFALHDSYAFGIRTTLGVTGGLALERAIRPKYWIRTHDTELVNSGLVMRLGIRDVARTLESALEEESKSGKFVDGMEAPRVPNYVEVDNGGCFILE